MEYPQNAGSLVEQKPDFQKLLDKLKEWLMGYSSLASEIELFSRNIKPMDTLKEENPTLVNKEPICLLDYFWHQVWDLEETNKKMQAIAHHLKSVVGS